MLNFEKERFYSNTISTKKIVSDLGVFMIQYPGMEHCYWVNAVSHPCSMHLGADHLIAFSGFWGAMVLM